MTDDFGSGPVRIHSNGKTRDPYMTIVGGFSGRGEMVRRPIWSPTAIGASEVEGFARVVGEDCSAVAIVEIEFSAWTSYQRMEAVVVVDGVEACEDYLSLVDLWIKLQVPVDISVGEKVRGLRDIDDVVEDRYAERCDKVGLLNEGVRMVTLSVSVCILQDDDPVSGRSLSFVSSIIDSFGNPDPTLVIDIHIGWVVELRGGGPDRHLEGWIELKHSRGNRLRRIIRFPDALCHKGGPRSDKKGQ
tara:strand:- start:71 stop:805 length:735 start_codon:yes stop_codon:yes gene_type:complete